MSSTITVPDNAGSEIATITTESTTEPAAATAAPDIASELEKWKAQSRKHEARAKENAAAALRLAEIEEASKTAEQKAADAAQVTVKERDNALAEAARLRAAVKFGLSEDDLAHLDGIPADRVEAIAEWVASRTTAPVKLPAAPPAAGTQGNVGKPIGSGSEAEQLAQGIDAATKAGRHAEAIHLKRQLSALNNKTN